MVIRAYVIDALYICVKAKYHNMQQQNTLQEKNAFSFVNIWFKMLISRKAGQSVR